MSALRPACLASGSAVGGADVDQEAMDNREGRVITVALPFTVSYRKERQKQVQRASWDRMGCSGVATNAFKPGHVMSWRPRRQASSPPPPQDVCMWIPAARSARLRSAAGVQCPREHPSHSDHHSPFSCPAGKSRHVCNPVAVAGLSLVELRLSHEQFNSPLSPSRTSRRTG